MSKDSYNSDFYLLLKKCKSENKEEEMSMLYYFLRPALASSELKPLKNPMEECEGFTNFLLSMKSQQRAIEYRGDIAPTLRKSATKGSQSMLKKSAYEYKICQAG